MLSEYYRIFTMESEGEVDNAMEQSKLDRINDLARTAKIRTLTAEEKEEQAKLRKEYIQLVHNNLRGQLDNIRIVEPDGTIHKIVPKN